MKHETLVMTRQALEKVERRLLENLHRLGSLAKPFNYKDWKETLLNEGEHEDDPDMPPFV